jgi:hypothetical protein
MYTLKLNTAIGAILRGAIVRCIVIGELSHVSNKVLIKRECDGKIFAIRPNLIAWVNEG